MSARELDHGVVEREGEGLVELEKALDSFLATASDGPHRKATIVIDLDLAAGRVLRNALQLARLSGAAVQ
jgi:hypothetical protein